MALGNNLKKKDGHRKSESQNQSFDTGEVGLHQKEQGKKESVEEQVNESVTLQQEEAKSSKNLILIVFYVGNEEYALPIDMVSEVVKTPPIAPIPQVPDFIKGVANVRGNVVTILDLALRMGLSREMHKTPGHLMVIKSDLFNIAVGIDQVPNTLTVDDKEIDHSSELMLHATLDEVYIKGIVKIEQRMIILIDILEMIAAETFAE